MKVGITFSGGGHYLEAMKACSLILNQPKYDVFFITYKRLGGEPFLKRTHFVKHPAHGFFLKRLFQLILNFFGSLAVYIKERPDVIISTGADVTLPSMVIAKIFGKKLIFIESGANVTKPSMTGKLIYHLSDIFIVQWEELKVHYPKAIVGINLL